jgi:hypothetical protein
VAGSRKIIRLSNGVTNVRGEINAIGTKRAIRQLETYLSELKTSDIAGPTGAAGAPGASAGSGTPGHLAMFTGTTVIGDSPVSFDGTTLTDPVATHSFSPGGTTPLTITDGHTGVASSVVELVIDAAGTTFSGSAGGGGPGVPSTITGLPGGAQNTMLVANAVATSTGPLTNIALYANAQNGATNNYALFAPHGDLNLGAGNSSLGGTLAVTGAAQLSSTLNVSQHATFQNGAEVVGGDLKTDAGRLVLTTAFGTPAPPSAVPAAVLIQEADETAAGDASLVWWTIGGTPFTYNVYAGAQNRNGVTNLNPQFVVGVQNAGTTGSANVTQQFSVTDASALVAGTLGVGNVTTPASTIDGHINADATGGLAILTLGNNFTGQNFAATIGVDNAKHVVLGTTSANTKWDWKTSGGTTVATISAHAGDSVITANGTLDVTNNKILNLANGSAAQDGAAFGQIATAVNAAVSGTANTIAKFTGTNTIGNSSITDDGTKVTASEEVYTTSTTAKAGRIRFVGKDVLGTTNNTDGPELILGLQIANRRSMMLQDSAAPTNGALDFTAGTAQGAGIQAVDNGWNAGQTLNIQLSGGPLVIGNNTNTATINSATSITSTLAVTGLVDLTGQSVYLGRQVLSATSGTYTPTTGTRKVFIQLVAGGGAGGGVVGGASGVAAGAGGNSGWYGAKWINPAATITGGAYHAGAGGTGGTGNGGSGNQSDIVIQGTTYTVLGGTGGTGGTATTTSAGPPPLAYAATPTGFDVVSASPGTTGFILSGAIAWSGTGGSGAWGVGGLTRNTAGAGSAGIGNGAGGGGAAVSTNANQNGGAGAAGLVIVDEWR